MKKKRRDSDRMLETMKRDAQHRAILRMEASDPLWMFDPEKRRILDDEFWDLKNHKS